MSCRRDGKFTRALLAMSLLPTLCLAAQAPAASPRQIPQPARPQPGRPQPAPVGNGTISGRVLAADTTLPIPGAQIRAFRSGVKDPLTARTDGQGRFVLTGVPNGSYRIIASRAPFLTQEYGQQWPGEPGTAVTVAGGRTVQSITVMLSPGGIISGRVLDEFGLPVAWAEVNASRITYTAGDRLVSVVASELTNDRGDFRLFGLARGDYFVSAFPSTPMLPGTPGTNDPAPNTVQPGAGYAPTYYPSEVRAGMGERLRVESAQEMAGIYISLLPTTLARVSGLALKSDGSPMGGATVALTGTILQLNDCASGVTKADGTFEFHGVVPDQDILRVSTRAASGETETAVLDLDVSGNDVEDLVLQGNPNGSVRGRIVTENERLPSMDGIQVRAMSRTTRARVGTMAQEARVDRDGSFALKLQPGSMWIGPVNLPPGWMLKAVRRGATDITDTGIDVGSSQDLAGITLVVTSRISSVRGTVRDSLGRTVRSILGS